MAGFSEQNNSEPGKIIHFLRLCYESDNRETAITNLFHEKVRHLCFLHKASEFLAGNIDVVPVDREAALEADKSALLHLTEKTLVFCTLIIAGRIRDPQSRGATEICAPLLFIPATVRDDGTFAYLEVEKQQQRLNRRVLQMICGGDQISEEAVDALLQNLPAIPFEPDALESLVTVLHEGWPGMELEPLKRFPESADEAQVRRAMRRGGDSSQLTLFNASAMALIHNSPETRGVLFELGQLAETGRTSPPLDALFGRSRFSPSGASKTMYHVPAALSRGQQQVLHSASEHPLSLIIGPPGTGKSYTLAALALDHAARGESVLIACRNNKAIDVVASKIQELAGNTEMIMRGGRRGYTSELIQRLNNLLQGLSHSGIREEVDQPAVERSRAELRQQANLLQAMEHKLQRRAAAEMNWGRLYDMGAAGGWIRRMINQFRFRVLDKRLEALPPYHEQIAEYHRRLEEYHRGIARSIELSVQYQKQKLLVHQRGQLVLLRQALRARTNLRQEQLFSQIDPHLLRSCFPVWMAPLSDLSHFIPFTGGLFDLVIVDEATQCDMAACLPAFFRGQRVAVTGDPQQLRHVSFASREQMKGWGSRFGLSPVEVEAYNYREKSILDLMNERIHSQHQIVFLEEHFRSRPQIISFSNAAFYNNSLRIMTASPSANRLQSVFLHPVPGRREESGINPIEAQALVSEVVRWVESEADLAGGVCHSIGILSPFRDQVDYLTSEMAKKTEAQALRKHQLLIGTAHAFQGEERDLMFLSFAIDDSSHPGSFRFLNRPDVFNVSITRARIGQHVFHSFEPERLPRSLLASYISSLREPNLERVEECEIRDDFRDDLCRELKKRGVHLWPSFPIAGMRMDLVAEKNGGTLGINLIGRPGPFGTGFDLERHRMFRRAGLRILALTWSEWMKRRDASVEAVLKALEP